MAKRGRQGNREVVDEFGDKCDFFSKGFTNEVLSLTTMDLFGCLFGRESNLAHVVDGGGRSDELFARAHEGSKLFADSYFVLCVGSKAVSH